jgi:hypothetical protein
LQMIVVPAAHKLHDPAEPVKRLHVRQSLRQQELKFSLRLGRKSRVNSNL